MALWQSLPCLRATTLFNKGDWLCSVARFGTPGFVRRLLKRKGVWCAVSGTMEYDWEQKHDSACTWRLDCCPCTVICNWHGSFRQLWQMCQALEIDLHRDFRVMFCRDRSNSFCFCMCGIMAHNPNLQGIWYGGTGQKPVWHPHPPNSWPTVMVCNQLNAHFGKGRQVRFFLHWGVSGFILKFLRHVTNIGIKIWHLEGVLLFEILDWEQYLKPNVWWHTFTMCK